MSEENNTFWRASLEAKGSILDAYGRTEEDAIEALRKLYNRCAEQSDRLLPLAYWEKKYQVPWHNVFCVSTYYIDLDRSDPLGFRDGVAVDGGLS